ncbi:retinal short-chain dehydrogenase/reductase [Crucibulum laeve]|uniref:Short-chain dehydrogenase/reductase 3 n=1 Tax=Crucibulum laeve TaxID=68775 RepID=A0A5C3MGG0_9AGAR|nr:retinal short-chain dehydrogenase/reductase [Crucibulum laeve]
MEADDRHVDGSPIFDSLDVDLVLKVLANTAFSPFFVFFIPVFYFFQGVKLTHPVIVFSSVYYVTISLFWFIKWYSRLYRNQGSLLFGPGPFDWGEQIIVVTGGSSGVGELLANTLAVRNVNVVVLDVNPIITENHNVTYYKCDVSKWEEVEAVSKKVIEEIGQPTVLVNNAGVVQGKLLLDLTPKDVQQTFGVNTLAHYWTLKAFLPGMLEAKRGHIVTVSSVLGLVGTAQMSDYNASKAALISLHESLRAELDKHYKCPKIRTTLVCPGHILTPMFKTISFPKASLFKFFFPSVQPVTVVKRIIQALDEQHSQAIMVPFYTNFMPAMKFMPSFIADFAKWISGADNAMDHFVKISGRREDEDPVPSQTSSKED